MTTREVTVEPDTMTAMDPREAVTAWCRDVRTHYHVYQALLRNLGDGDVVPAPATVDAASGERLRSLIMTRAPAAERQVGMLLGCQHHLAEIVGRYGRRFVHGVADAPRLAKELDAELARLDTLELEIQATLGAP